MRMLQQLFANNRAWAEAMVRQDSYFFMRLAQQQSPRSQDVLVVIDEKNSACTVHKSPGILFEIVQMLSECVQAGPCAPLLKPIKSTTYQLARVLLSRW